MAEHAYTGMMYNDSKNSTIGPQAVEFQFIRKALTELAPERYFTQLASSIKINKNQGKTIKRDRYVPVLDDENINNQGIDATANHDEFEVTIIMKNSDGMKWFGVGKGKTGLALGEAKKNAFDILKNLKVKQAVTDYDTDKAALEGAGWTFEELPERANYGNMYGSSEDIGVITSKMPIIQEQGGSVNRIGFTRKQFEAGIKNYGFYFEYTEDSMNFDTYSDLLQIITKEAMTAAHTVVEDQIQIDLLNSAGIVYYGGDATSLSEVTGETNKTKSTLTYDGLRRLTKMLDKKRCPTSTKIVTGSRNIDTRTINKARYAYVGADLVTTLYKMKNYHDEKAFIHAHQYADASTLAVGEIGSIDNIRFIQADNMKSWKGKGATVTNNGGYYESNGKYDVYPLLIVGDQSFNTIGFDYDGSEGKFKIMHKRPGLETMSFDDPYGKKGIWSIQWWYGFMAVRPEWIAVMKVVAER